MTRTFVIIFDEKDKIVCYYGNGVNQAGYTVLADLKKGDLLKDEICEVFRSIGMKEYDISALNSFSVYSYVITIFCCSDGELKKRENIKNKYLVYQFAQSLGEERFEKDSMIDDF